MKTPEDGTGTAGEGTPGGGGGGGDEAPVYVGTDDIEGTFYLNV